MKAATGATGVSCRQLFAARAAWDLDPTLSATERSAVEIVASWRPHYGKWTDELRHDLARLLIPIDAVTMMDGQAVWGRYEARRVLLRATHVHGTPMWEWSRETWVSVAADAGSTGRQVMLRIAYVACDLRDLHRSFGGTKRHQLVGSILGFDDVAASLDRIHAHAGAGGFVNPAGNATLLSALFELMLQTRSARLEDLSGVTLSMELFPESNHWIRSGLSNLSRTLASMGIPDVHALAPPDTPDAWLARTTTARADVSPEWAEWAQRWWRTSPLAKQSRAGVYYALLKVGRWLCATHPDVVSPQHWTRELAAEWVAAVARMNVGEYSHAPSTVRYAQRVGQPLSARARHQHITLMGRFLRDCQEWGWATLSFNPTRTFRTPRSISALIGPDPRIVADDIWAKLLWAGLNLGEEDLPAHGHSGTFGDCEGKPWYPLEMVRAVALLWLFTGLRSNEIHRLRTGCIRTQAATSDNTGEEAPQVCLLDVPVTKTSTAFTKPIDPIVGQAIEAWERVRPAQPRFIDTKTGESVDMLFALRGNRMSDKYLNRVLIPLLCSKANVPASDARGPITSHRARSTIATMLYNAKDPMTLFELQSWLGHSSPHSTQQYARISPVTLTKAFTDAGYFARNLRTIEVLIDRDAVRNGTAATGTPWEFFDLGHGWCTYNFFEQCPHRMACARCDFYIPKPSAAAQLLEANTNLARMLIEIPLTDDERAAIEDGQDATRRLLERLADTPTPAGPTPRALTRPVPVAAPTRKRRPVRDEGNHSSTDGNTSDNA